MSCRVSEEQLALYAGGDLNSDEKLVVSAHVGECEACRQVLSELEAAQALLAQGLGEPAEEDLRILRVAVAGRVHGRRSLAWRFAAVAAACAVAVSIPIALRRDHRVQAQLVTAVVELPAPALTRPELVILSVARTSRIQRRVRHVDGGAGVKDVVLRPGLDGKPEVLIATADPNVVILFSSGGESHEN